VWVSVLIEVQASPLLLVVAVAELRVEVLPLGSAKVTVAPLTALPPALTLMVAQMEFDPVLPFTVPLAAEPAVTNALANCTFAVNVVLIVGVAVTAACNVCAFAVNSGPSVHVTLAIPLELVVATPLLGVVVPVPPVTLNVTETLGTTLRY
jgi:hypothetical protein